MAIHKILICDLCKTEQSEHWDGHWYLVCDNYTERTEYHMSELEANQKGIFRDRARTKSYSISKVYGALHNWDGSDG
jgi:hypothetical protein